MVRLRPHAFALLLLAAATAVARADEAPASWSLLAPSDSTLSPGGVDIPAVVDPIRRRVLLLGDGGILAGVWAMPLDGPAHWEHVPASGQPFAVLSGCAAIFDPVGDRMLVIGGIRDGGDFTGVWQLTFAGSPAWSKLTTSGPEPSHRVGSSAIYDPVRRRMIVFSGDAAASTNDVWALSLDGTPAWQLLAPGGASPPARRRHAAVYDSRRDRMLVLGGSGPLLAFPYLRYFDDVWALPLSDGGAWESLAVAGTPPPAREGFPAVYDSLHDRVEFYGGTRSASSVYYGDHAWLSLAGSPQWLDGAAPGGPGTRGVHASAIDPENARFFVFAGVRSLEELHDAWVVPTEGPRAWSRLSPALPAGRPPATFAPLVFLDHRSLVVIPGVPDYYSSVVGGLWTCDLDGGGWQLRRADAGYPGVCCVDTAGHRLLSFAITSGSPFYKMGIVRELPLDGSAPWTQNLINGALPDERTAPDVILDAPRRRILLYGGTSYPIPGHSSVSHYDVLSLSLDTLTWRTIAPETPALGPGHVVWDTGRDRLVFVPGSGGPLSGLALDSASSWQPLGWNVGRMPQDVYGSWPPLQSPALHYDGLRDRLVTSTRGESLWVLPLGHAGDWTPLPNAGASPHGDAWLAAFDAVADRGYAFGGSITSNGVWDVAFDVTVPAAVALVRAVATSAGVELEWGGAPPAFAARVERRTPESGWAARGEAVADGSGSVRWSEPGVAPGRYAYRLAWNEAGTLRTTGEAWVEVPGAPALAFLGVFPNPAATAPMAAFTLPGPADVELEVFDAAGRRVAALRIAGVAPGAHRVALPGIEDASPGVGFVRFRAAGLDVTRRIAIVR